MNIEESQLPDTQKSDGIDFSQAILEDRWGVLSCVRRSCRAIVLTKSQYTVGRSTHCDVVFVVQGKDKQETVQNSAQVMIREPQNKIYTISKIHFKIFKDSDIVYLEDNSFNGTFVNGTVVGKGNKIILQNNDEISLSDPKYKYFVFSSEELCSYPDLKNNYFISETLGSGSYGEVKLVVHKRTFAKYAVKIVPVKDMANNGGTNEVEILKALDNPFVIKYDHAIITSEKILIFLEYMEGGDLARRIKSCGKLEETCSRWIFYQLVNGVEYLHDQRIAHRDLKPENILLSSGRDFPIVKISDFGFSKFISSETCMKTLCGTPLYVAPEILETKGKGIYTNKVDVWSMGVILYVCLSGCTPFNLNCEDVNLYEQIMTGKYKFSSPVWKCVSSEVIALISQMMTVDPMMRITVKMVKDHPWLKNKQFEEKLKQLDELVLLHFREVRNENDPPLKRMRC